MLAENRAKLPAADVSNLESLIAEGRDAIEKQDDARVRGALERLEHESHRIAQALYQQQGGPAEAGQAGPPPGATAGGAPKQEGVVDAEFEDTH
jgi:molecular chaperone DnaK